MKQKFKSLLAVLLAVTVFIAPVILNISVYASEALPVFDTDKHTDITHLLTPTADGNYINYSSKATGYTVQSTSSTAHTNRVGFSNVYTANNGTLYFQAKLDSNLQCGGNDVGWSGPVIYFANATSETKGEGKITAVFTYEHGMDLRFKNANNADIQYIGNSKKYPDTNTVNRSSTEYVITAAITNESLSVWVNGTLLVDKFLFSSKSLSFDAFEPGIGFICTQGTVSDIRAWCSNGDFTEPDKTPKFNNKTDFDLNSVLQMSCIGESVVANNVGGQFSVETADTESQDYVNYGRITPMLNGGIVYTAKVNSGITGQSGNGNSGPIIHFAEGQMGSKAGKIAFLLSETLGIRLVLTDEDNNIVAYVKDYDYSASSLKVRQNIDYSITLAFNSDTVSLFVNGRNIIGEQKWNSLGLTFTDYVLSAGFINAAGRIESIRAWCSADEYNEPIDLTAKISFVKTEIAGGVSTETEISSDSSRAVDSDSNDKTVMLTADTSALINESGSTFTKTVFASRTAYPTDNGLQFVRMAKVLYKDKTYFADLLLTKSNGVSLTLVNGDNTVTDIVLKTAKYIKQDGTKTDIRFDIDADFTVLTSSDLKALSVYMNGFCALTFSFNSEITYAGPVVGAGVRNMKTYTSGFVKRYNTGVKDFNVLCHKLEKYSNAPVYDVKADTNLNANTETKKTGSNITITDQVNNDGKFKVVSKSSDASDSIAEFYDYNIKSDGTLYICSTLKGELNSTGDDADFGGPVWSVANIEKDGLAGQLSIRFTQSKGIELFSDGDSPLYFGQTFSYPDTLNSNRGSKNYEVIIAVNPQYVSLWVNGEQIISKYSFADNNITFKSLASVLKFNACKGTVDDIMFWCDNSDATAVPGPPVFDEATDYNLTNDIVAYSQSGATVTKSNGSYALDVTTEGKTVNFNRLYVKNDAGYVAHFVLEPGAKSSETWGGQEFYIANVTADGKSGTLSVRFMQSGGVRLHVTNSGSYDYYKPTAYYPDSKSSKRNDSIDYDTTVVYDYNTVTVWMNGKKIMDENIAEWTQAEVKITEPTFKFAMTKTTGAISDIRAWTKPENVVLPDPAPAYDADTDIMLSDYMRSGSASTYSSNIDKQGIDVDIKKEGATVGFGELYLKELGSYSFSATLNSGMNTSIGWGGMSFRLGTLQQEGKSGYLEIRFSQVSGIILYGLCSGKENYFKTATYPDTGTKTRNDSTDYKITAVYSKDYFSLWVNGILVMDNIPLTVPEKEIKVIDTDFSIASIRTVGKISDIKIWCNKSQVAFPELKPEFDSRIHTNLTEKLVPGTTAGFTATYNSNGTYNISAKEINKKFIFSNLLMQYRGTLYTKVTIKAGTQTDVAWAGPEIYVANVIKDGRLGYLGIRLTESSLGVATHMTNNGTYDTHYTKSRYPDSYTMTRNDSIDYEIVVRSNLNEISIWINGSLVLDKQNIDYDDITVVSPCAGVWTSNCTVNYADYKVWCEKGDVLKSEKNPNVTNTIFAANGVPVMPEGNINYADKFTDATFASAGTQYGFYWDKDTNTFWNDNIETTKRMIIGNFTTPGQQAVGDSQEIMDKSATYAIKFKYTVKDYLPAGEGDGSMGLRFYFRGFTGYSATTKNITGIMLSVAGAVPYSVWKDSGTVGGSFVDFGFVTGKTYDIEILTGLTELALWIDGKQIFYYSDLPDCGPYFAFEVHRALVKVEGLEIYNIEPETYDNRSDEMQQTVSKTFKSDKIYNLNTVVKEKQNKLKARIIYTVSCGVLLISFIVFTVFFLLDKKKRKAESQHE